MKLTLVILPQWLYVIRKVSGSPLLSKSGSADAKFAAFVFHKVV